MLNDVFINSPLRDSNYKLVQFKSKFHHFKTSIDSLINKNKNKKPIFASSNRFLMLDNKNTGPNHAGGDLFIDTEQRNKTQTTSLFIFIRRALHFSAFCVHLIKLVGASNFIVKSTTNNLKIKITNSDSYRTTIKYHKEYKIESNTYQAQD